jgi:hypothetical protein
MVCVAFGLSSMLCMGDGRISLVGPDSIDFGQYPAWEKRAAHYTIANTGTDDLMILRVRKTCGCASAACSTNRIAAGEHATVTVDMLPGSLSGNYSKNIFVESSDPSNRFIKLSVMGNAVPLVQVTPDHEVYAGRIKQGAGWNQTFQLVPSRPGIEFGEPVVASSHPVTAAFNKAATNTLASSELALTLPPTDASGDLRCSIEVPVIAPDNHPPIKISVSGRIGTELSIIPGTAYLTFSDDPQTRHFSLRILGQRSRKLDPEELILPDHKQITSQISYNATRNTLEGTLTFSPEFLKELYVEEKIPLTFSMPGTASAQLLCRFKGAAPKLQE